MLTIKFKVDKDILAREMIHRRVLGLDDANQLWNKYTEDYKKLKNDPLSDIDSSIIKDLQSRPIFEQYYLESTQFLKSIQDSWAKKEKFINEYLSKALKTDFDINVTGYIVSPKLCTGHSYDDSFTWGHINGIADPNYNLVYCVHEALHSYFARDIHSHAVIEKISDIELAKSLNNSEVGYPHHKYTAEVHKIIEKEWDKYISSHNANIHQFIKHLQNMEQTKDA